MKSYVLLLVLEISYINCNMHTIEIQKGRNSLHSLLCKHDVNEKNGFFETTPGF